MNKACLEFGRRVLKTEDVAGKDVLEVGARNINGTFRTMIEAMGPASYIGTDIIKGSGVDEICAAEKILEKFGPGRFDLIVSTEMLEHVRDWRAVVSNMKRVLRPNGVIVLTTRYPGYPFHECPEDHWRWTERDIEAIFANCQVEVAKQFPGRGVGARIRKPLTFHEAEPLPEYALREAE